MKRITLKSQGLTKDGTGREPKTHLDSHIGIYGMICDDLQSIYIGQSKNIPSRTRNHLNKLRNNLYLTSNFQWQADFNTVSELNFRFIVLENCDETELDKLETNYIKEYLDNGWYLYNKQLITNDLTMIQCAKAYAPVIKSLIKALDCGKLNLQQIEEAVQMI